MKKYLVASLITIVVIGLLVIYLVSPPITKQETEIEPNQDTALIPEPVLRYGLPIDSFIIEEATVKRNQNLSDILVQKNISYQTIDEIAKKSKPIFDVRRLKYRNPYYFFLKKDSLQTPAYFVYDIDDTNYVIYQFQDSIHVYKGEKPVVRKLRKVSGTIESSLWNAMVDNDIDPVLAIDLSEIYAWSIDFFGIQKGDQFRVIYDEDFVDSTSIGIGQIYACQFRHADEDFYAFRFEQDSSFSYFDNQGKSLKKAFLKAPLKYSRISSRFTNSRYHPVLKISRPHHGVDYAASIGTPVHSIGDGVVTRKGYQKLGGGNYLYIKHNSVYTTSYMHLNGYAKGIYPGVRVHQGQLIGYVGKTGLATGPHLDFRVYRNGSPMNPLKLKAPPVEPVKEKNIPEFNVLKDSLIAQLDSIPFKN